MLLIQSLSCVEYKFLGVMGGGGGSEVTRSILSYHFTAEYIRVLLSQYEGKIVFPVNYSNGGKLKWAKISEFLSM